MPYYQTAMTDRKCSKCEKTIPAGAQFITLPTITRMTLYTCKECNEGSDKKA
jgi:hypothetical protein